MSGQFKHPNDWVNAQPISHEPKGVLRYLTMRANKDRRTWPSRDTMMRDIGCSKDFLTNTLRYLDDEGYITREESHRENGSRTTDVITVHWDSGVITPVQPYKAPRRPQLKPNDYLGLSDRLTPGLPDRPMVTSPRPVAQAEDLGLSDQGGVGLSERQPRPVGPGDHPALQESSEEASSSVAPKQTDVPPKKKPGSPQAPGSKAGGLARASRPSASPKTVDTTVDAPATTPVDQDPSDQEPAEGGSAADYFEALDKATQMLVDMNIPEENALGLLKTLKPAPGFGRYTAAADAVLRYAHNALYEYQVEMGDYAEDLPLDESFASTASYQPPVVDPITI